MLKFFNKTRGKSGMVGLYATPENLTLAFVSRQRGALELSVCEEVAASGAEARAAALETLVKKHQLENTPTTFVLSPNDYKLLLVEAPNVETDELAGAVKWKIKDLVGHPIEEMAITVFDVPEGAYRSQANMVYAVAARKTRIKDIVELVFGAQLDLAAIDIPELVMMNLTSACIDDGEGLAFLDLREDGSTLNLMRKGEIYLTRRLNTRLDNHVMNSHEWDSIRERLVMEIQRSLDYYQSQMGQSLIPRIVIAPRPTDADRLTRELHDALAVNVETLNIPQSIRTSQALPMELQQSCMMAIGGAMRDGVAA